MDDTSSSSPSPEVSGATPKRPGLLDFFQRKVLGRETNPELKAQIKAALSNWFNEYGITQDQYERRKNASAIIYRAWKTNSEKLELQLFELTSIPPVIGQLTNLKILNLFHNNIKELPREIGSLNNLRSLDVSYNQLILIPDTIDYLGKGFSLNAERNPISGPDRKRLLNVKEGNEWKEIKFSSLDAIFKTIDREIREFKLDTLRMLAKLKAISMSKSQESALVVAYEATVGRELNLPVKDRSQSSKKHDAGPNKDDQEWAKAIIEHLVAGENKEATNLIEPVLEKARVAVEQQGTGYPRFPQKVVDRQHLIRQFTEGLLSAHEKLCGGLRLGSAWNSVA